MSARSDWPRNRLLLALPAANLKRLAPEFERIRCQRGQILMDADSPLDHAFFPDSGVISVVAVYANGSIIEMATNGREGCSAVQAVLGAKSSSVRLFVQIPGSATKMSRTAFTRAMGSTPAFRNLMYAYARAFLEQVLVSVACNGAHSLKERLARWLLMMRDRSDDDELQITQTLLAEMLGVQRPTIYTANLVIPRRVRSKGICDHSITHGGRTTEARTCDAIIVFWGQAEGTESRARRFRRTSRDFRSDTPVWRHELLQYIVLGRSTSVSK